MRPTHREAPAPPPPVFAKPVSRAAAVLPTPPVPPGATFVPGAELAPKPVRRTPRTPPATVTHRPAGGGPAVAAVIRGLHARDNARQAWMAAFILGRPKCLE